MIKHWTISRLFDYESCPLKAKLKHVDKIPDPKPSPAADRGTAIHSLAEGYLKGEIDPLPKELMKFEDEFVSLRSDGSRKLMLEEEWGFDKDWQPCGYRAPEMWGRMKLDICVEVSPTQGVVIDIKTGKKFGNEIKHGEQTQMYALGAFIRHPEWQELMTELWYVDVDEMLSVKVSRKTAFDRYLKVFDHRVRKMTSATEFPAKPNIVSCKWCPYGDTGHCDQRVVDEQASKGFYKRKYSKKE